MKLWGYYAFHTFINSIKKMLKSVVVVVILCFSFIGIIIGLSVGLLASSMTNDESAKDEAVEEEIVEYVFKYADDTVYNEDSFYVDSEGNITDKEGTLIGLEEISEEEDNYSDYEGCHIWTNRQIESDYLEKAGYELDWDDVPYASSLFSDEDIAQIKECVGALAFFIMLICVLWGIYSGSKKGSDIFLMADVNLLFISPKKPQTILMFRLSFQLFAALVGLLYLCGQIPNLINAGLSAGSIIVCFFAIVFLVLIQRLVSVFSYTLTSTHMNLKKYVFPFVCSVAIIFAGINYFAYTSCSNDIFAACHMLYNVKVLSFIPLFGWCGALVVAAINSQYMNVLLFGFLLILLMVLMIVGIWSIPADFYEDALEGATAREELMIKQKEGQPAKKKKDRSERIKRDGLSRGSGASIFFFKEMYNRRRFSLFGFLTKTMVTYILIGMAALTVSNMAVGNPVFIAAMFTIAAVLFFRTFANPLQTESSLNWLLMVPDSPYKKVFMVVIAGTVECVMDLVPIMIISLIVCRVNPLTWVLWFGFLILLDFMLSNVSVMINGIIPSGGLGQLKGMIQLSVIFIIFAIIIVLFAVGTFASGLTLGVILNILLCIVFGAISFIVYPSILHKGEF
ncbi:MAG: putative ABC exporter domain-containing protein [Lachnospira sp.]